MPKHKNAVVIIYKITNKNNSEVKIRLYPLLTCRHYHTVINKSKVPLNFALKSTDKQFEAVFQRPQAAILCRSTDGQFKEGINWLTHLHYRAELMRGEADVDDCFQPGYFELEVQANIEKEFAVTCAVSHESQETERTLDSIDGSIKEIQESFVQEVNQDSELLSIFLRNHLGVPLSDWLNWVLLAADSFLVADASGKKAVIAGYHWFETWGRDTFISLPGLLLVTGKYGDAKNILQSFIKYSKSGLIPNFVPDNSDVPVYDTVDATLWYINAVLQYVKYTGNFGFVKDELWEKLRVLVDYHQKGTLFGIHVDRDGLLMHGPRLTWMDAAVGNDAITPRAGKAVEIQALWYNALKTMELLAKEFEAPSLAENYNLMANNAKQNFSTKFWNPQKNCLYDVIDEETLDASIRPNQIFAVSLEFTMLDFEKSQKVVEIVNRELVTPYGLRTLSVGDPKFIGKCAGDRRSRDMAYHNGTIWPWLLGSYVTAYLKVNSYTAKAREQVLENLVLPLFTKGIRQGCLGSINEIYDSDPPNEPRGCISQAWSIAEPLRAYVEEIMQIKPKKVYEVLDS